MVPSRFRFGDCTLDIPARELRRAGARVDLPPTVFDCIAYLVAHRDRAVGRDELIAAVWGKTEVSDTMLGKAILAARRAVGDTAEAQVLLRTVPRFGYHWVGDTRIQEIERSEPAQDTTDEAGAHRSSAADVAEPPPIAAPSAPQMPTSRWRTLSQLAIGLLIVAGVGAVVVSLRSTPPRPPASSTTTHDGPEQATALAVLPVDVLTDGSDDWLRLGLMDLIATRLRDAGIAVVRSDSVVRVVDARMTTTQAMAALHAAIDTRGVILPAVRKSGNEWIVRAELIDGSASPRSVQAHASDAISATDQVVGQLLGLLGKTSAAATMHADPGLAELLQRTDAARLAENLDLARALIAQAAPALQAMPEVRERGVRIALRSGEFDKARVELEVLLREVPAEADAVMHARFLEDLCSADMRLGRLEDALRACDTSIALLEPRNEPLPLGRAYNDRALLHERMNRHDAAMADFARSRIAITLAGDPLLLAQLDGNVSIIEMGHGRPSEALPTLERAGHTFRRFGMVNEFVTALVNQVEAHLMLLQPLDALKASDAGWAERSRVTDPQVRHAFEAGRAQALAANGRLEEARVVLDQLIHAADPPPDTAQLAIARSNEAELDLVTGAPESARVLARQALEALATPQTMRERARAWLLLTRAIRQLGQTSDAADETAAFATWAQSVDVPLATLDASLANAEQCAVEERHADAVAAYERAMQAADQRGLPDRSSETAVSYATWLLARGDVSQAADVVGKVARYADRDFSSALVEARLYRALVRQDAFAGAMTRVRRLAGERRIPDELASAGAAPLALGTTD
ncbi:MAG: winged helix-turn-helix domain-containing protein [Dokdonella sp.]|uniref:winged helix-turn-helix domain-containing protein n=1 Tax=Dokdonella sp. TaxID=2291710 RepID=UPI0032636424